MKHILIIAILFVSIVGKAQESIRADSLIAFSKKFIGTSYKYAVCDPSSGFDCSGFVYYVFNHFKVKVPRSSIDFSNFGKIIPLDSCKVGDIIVFTGTNAKNRNPGHVGIIVNKLGEEVQFIHSSSNKKKPGVKLSSFKESPYYKVRFLKVVRATKVY